MLLLNTWGAKGKLLAAIQRTKQCGASIVIRGDETITEACWLAVRGYDYDTADRNSQMQIIWLSARGHHPGREISHLLSSPIA